MCCRETVWYFKKTKKVLVKSTYYVIQYTVCNFVTFITERKNSPVDPTAQVKSVVKSVTFSHKL